MNKDAKLEEKILNLLLSAQKGCQKSLGDLYIITKPMLMSYLRKLRYIESDSEEIVQNVFLKLQKSNKYNVDKSSALSFMFMITQRTAIDYLRHMKALRRNIPTQDISKVNPAAESQSSHVDSDLDMNKIIACMTKIDSQIIKLHFVRDYTYEQIAKMTNTPCQTIKSRFRRAFIEAREKLGDNHEKLK